MDRIGLIEPRVARETVGGFFDAYRALGFGLPERMCANALVLELQKRGLSVVREVPIEVLHLGVAIGTVRLDLVIENRVVVEVKSAKELDDSHTRQLLTYLKVSPYELGILVNFGPTPQHHRFIYTNDRKQLRSN